MAYRLLKGVALREVRHSMAWHSASTPVEAAMAGGRRRIISPSRMTASGIMASQTMPTFNSFSGTATMALGVASAPVPAVVGIITVGMTLRPRDGSSSRAFTVTSPSRMEQSLAMSITLPPPTATMACAPAARKASTVAWAC